MIFVFNIYERLQKGLHAGSENLLKKLAKKYINIAAYFIIATFNQPLQMRVHALRLLIIH